MLHQIVEAFTGKHEGKKVKGTVVLMKKNVLDLNDFNASFLDDAHDLLGQKVSLQLVSAVNGDPGNLVSCMHVVQISLF
jgi:linoleate 9S-lipoxygenase